MAPLKSTKASTLAARPTIATRSRAAATSVRVKRKAEDEAVKETGTKRSALGDISNNVTAKNIIVGKANQLKQVLKNRVSTKTAAPPLKPVHVARTAPKAKGIENLLPPAAPKPKVVTRATAGKVEVSNQTALKPKEVRETANKVKTRLSNEFEKTEESLYSTALEDLGGKPKSPPVSDVSFCSTDSSSNNTTTVSMVADQMVSKLNLGNHEVPEGVDDFDKENWNDTFQCSHYAMDIFNYLKSREPFFQISDYMERQVCLSAGMRSLLVDWMVEVQESFELNHETLYLGVKLVDIYLSRVVVGKETLQLVGAAAMFIASKYDERIPPLIDDFLYICDGAYLRRDFIKTEINLLKMCEFNLGIPLSYRFLRRYARCAKITMPVLTLARYILEHSLMDYNTVTVTDSKLAAASMYLALRMKKLSKWTPALEFYSGYKLPEIMSTVYLLNDGLHKKYKPPVKTIRNKYSHKIFFEVAKTPMLDNEDLL